MDAAVISTPVRLRAGPLTLWFEPETAFLRRIAVGEREVVRGIYAAVRDRNWGTVRPRVTDLATEVGAESFVARFAVECREGDIDFRWRGEITGAADGTVAFGMDGTAMSRFWRNRIGFCVLHPIRECAGARARQTRVDGRVRDCRFPERIEPQIFGQSSFRGLRALVHEVAEDLWAEVEFAGEEFEMEDQRNWTDASFKTYGTPLSLPFPVEVRSGTRVQQRITLRLLHRLPGGWQPVTKVPRAEPAGAGGGGAVDDERAGGGWVVLQSAESGRERVTLSLPGAPVLRLPRLGLGAASHGEPLTELQVDRLRRLRLAHLRVDIRLGDPGWPGVFERAAREAAQLGGSLEVAVHVPPSGISDLPSVRACLQADAAPLGRVLALAVGEAATSLQTLRMVRELVAGWDVPVGAGSDANFCELNREQALGRCAVDEADFVFWSMNPQVHASDDWSVMETLEAQPATVKTARGFAGGRPLVVSPVTLKQRFNPVATGPEPLLAPGELPPQVDPRQRELFAAAWTLGSLAGLAGAGVESVTYYETTGWRGLMEHRPAAGSGGGVMADTFPSRPGDLFAVFELFAALQGGRGAAVLGDALRVAGMAVWDETDRRRVLLANLTGEPLGVTITECPPRLGLRRLGEGSVGSGAAVALPVGPDGRASVAMGPHACVVLDLVA